MRLALRSFAVSPGLIRRARQTLSGDERSTFVFLWNSFRLHVAEDKRSLGVACLYVDTELTAKFQKNTAINHRIFRTQASERRIDSTHGQCLSFGLLCNPYKFRGQSFEEGDANMYVCLLDVCTRTAPIPWGHR
jgi:hypothetical protein